MQKKSTDMMIKLKWLELITVISSCASKQTI